MRVTVLGAGAWGSALGILLHQGGHQTTLWDQLTDHLEELHRTRRNDRFLPGTPLPDSWIFEPDFDRAVAAAECMVIAVPSKYLRPLAKRLAGSRVILVSATKGIEIDTGMTMSAILREQSPEAGIVALSGPTLALEVARQVPTAIVAACSQIETARTVQQLLHQPAFRVYTTTDVVGVELGGSLKNVIAIGAGVSDGLGLGDNTKAALITRGVAEMRRLGVACGAQPETFAGLSGLGDLAVTCFSRLSRNRGFGERLGRGEKVEAILSSLISTAEGYPTAKSAYLLAQRLGVYAPIIGEIYAMLYEGKDVAQAVRDLTSRDSKPED